MNRKALLMKAVVSMLGVSSVAWAQGTAQQPTETTPQQQMGTQQDMGQPGMGMQDTQAQKEMGKQIPAQDLSRQDKKFVKDAIEAHRAEIDMARIALDKSTNAEVRGYAQTLIDDHSNALSQATQIAQNYAVEIKPEAEADKTRAEKRMQNLTGDKLDRHFVSHMVKDHKKEIDKFEKQARRSDTDEIRQYAQAVVPTLRKHLDVAQRLEKSLKEGSELRETGSKAGEGYGKDSMMKTGEDMGKSAKEMDMPKDEHQQHQEGEPAP